METAVFLRIYILQFPTLISDIVGDFIHKTYFDIYFSRSWTTTLLLTQLLLRVGSLGTFFDLIRFES